VEWSILHAKQSTLVDRVIVSTDSEEIRDIALQTGAEVPFLRPVELSGDTVLDHPVFEHALNWLRENESVIPEIVVHLRPTAPYRCEGWIDAAITTLFSNSDADAVRSVSEVTQHPYRVFQIDEYGMLIPIMRDYHPTPALLRRQDQPTMYFYNCVIDVTRASTILEKKSMTGDRLAPWIMAADDVIDIDTPMDLAFAEWFMSRLEPE
jgi:CMP-N-acetylneuraminic acid synthetase